MSARTIFLIGFMGSGKSTFGKKLANKLQLGFIDLDEVIAYKFQLSIKAIIEQHGIDFFREAERDTLKGLDTENAVISTGGGTPCFFDNMEWIKSRGVVVFLNLDEGIIFSRLKTTNLQDRPLLKDLDDDGLKQFIKDKLAERLPFYTRAHISFDPVHGKMEELVERLIA
ncbi:MAG: shikimate kinase [Bacteroidota bacterium]|nr:shikimate kinase [Bacteroidota bacterium]